MSHLQCINNKPPPSPSPPPPPTTTTTTTKCPPNRNLNDVIKILTVSLLINLTLFIQRAELTVIVKRPNGGAATLVPGQPLQFECHQIDNSSPQFKWYKKSLVGGPDSTRRQDLLLDPNADDNIEIHNERLSLLKPDYDAVGDYVCVALDENNKESLRESAEIKLRAQPYIDDFGIELSHTGKSATVTDGDRLELVCKIRDESVPINITWLRSNSADDDTFMRPIPEIDSSSDASISNLEPFDATGSSGPSVQTFISPSNVIVQRIDRFTKKLIIQSVGPEHRGFYACLANNGVTESSRKTIFVRVKDRIIALWPFLGIMAELFILFTIIYFWETQRAQKAIASANSTATKSSKRPSSQVPTSSGHTKRIASGPTNAFESVPLNR